jgi:RNA polymerase sigma factor (sigma-70 family)
MDSRIESAPLLTPRQEIELARIIQAGLAPDATDRQKKQSRRAINRMIMSNVRHVAKIANRYRSRLNHMDFDDLLQEGMFGLNRASEKFDPTRGNKFSTYSHAWIQQMLNRALNNQGDMIRIPIHSHDQAVRFKKTATANPDLSPEEIAELSGANLDIVRLVVRARQTCSLNVIVGERNTELMDMQADESQEGGGLLDDLGIDKKQLVEFLENILDAREFKIIKLYYGLGGTDAVALKEIAKEFGMSRQAIGHTKKVAMQKIRDNIHHLKVNP